MRVLLTFLLVLMVTPTAFATGDVPSGDGPPEPPDCSAMRCGVSRDSCGVLDDGSDNVILNAGDALPLINFGARLMFEVCKGTENRIVQFEIFADSTASDDVGDTNSVPLLRLHQPMANALCFDYYALRPALQASALSTASPIASSHCVLHPYTHATFDVRVGEHGRMEHRVRLGPGYWTDWYTPSKRAVDINLQPYFEAFLFGL